MGNLRYLVCGVALLAVAGASSAPAANWDPANTNFTITQEGAGQFITNTGFTFICASSSSTLNAPAASATARTVNTTPFVYNGCLGQTIFSLHWTTFGTWHFTATSTTSVDITATPDALGRFETLIFTGMCNITIDGPVSIPNNTWNNATHQLTINSAVSFPITAVPGESCQTVLGTSARFNNTSYTAPLVSIT